MLKHDLDGVQKEVTGDGRRRERSDWSIKMQAAVVLGVSLTLPAHVGTDHTHLSDVVILVRPLQKRVRESKSGYTLKFPKKKTPMRNRLPTPGLVLHTPPVLNW